MADQKLTRATVLVVSFADDDKALRGANRAQGLD